jgi:hypothetical protein
MHRSLLSEKRGVNKLCDDRRAKVARTPGSSAFFDPFRTTAERSDSMRPAMDRVSAGVALPVASARPAALAALLAGGFSAVVVLAIFEMSPFTRRSAKSIGSEFSLVNH